jgi:lycopene cyclase domain-containing protein
MSYTQIALCAVAAAALLDLALARTKLLLRRAFWTSYAIILPFQLLTNWWLTSRNIVMYDRHRIIGPRLASAPLEDIAFGFALILSVLSLWVYWGRRGIGVSDGINPEK